MKLSSSVQRLLILRSRSQEDGFGWWEVIAMLVVLGILGFIGSLLYPNQTNKCCGSSPKQYLTSISRSQQAYYLEEGRFSLGLEDLGLSEKFIPSRVLENYTFRIQTARRATFSYAIANAPTLRSYVSAVFVTKVNGEDTTSSILCESKAQGISNLAPPTYQKGVLACGKGTNDLSSYLDHVPKHYLENINYSQQAYYLKKSRFAVNFREVGLGQTFLSLSPLEHHKLRIETTRHATFAYIITKRGSLPSYVGAVFATKGNGGKATSSIICESKARGIPHLAAPAYQKGVLACGKGTNKL